MRTRTFSKMVGAIAASLLLTSSAIAEEKVKLRVMEWISSHGGGEIYRQQLEKYEELNPHVEIEVITHPWSVAHDKVLIMSNAGEIPDLLGVNRTWLLEFASLDLLADLTPYAEQIPGFRNKFYEQLKGEKDGKVLILPYMGGNSAMVINRGIFDAEQLEVPTTFDEFLETAKKLSKDGKYGAQLTVSAKNPAGSAVGTVVPIMLSFGAKLVENNKAAFNSPEGAAAFKWMMDLERVHKASGPGSLTVDTRRMRESLAVGKSAMNFDGAWGTPFYNSYPDVKIEVVPMIEGKDVGTVVNIMSWGIAKESKNVEETWKLLSFLMNNENLLELYRKGNVMPAVSEFGDMPEFSKYAGFFKTLEQSKNYFQTGTLPNETQFYKILINAYHEAFLGKKTIEAALDDAAQKYNAILDEYYNN